jgi:NAD(P)-dependent dehydrogenase (short-subunit alcohol dehydrogenase family)
MGIAWQLEKGNRADTRFEMQNKSIVVTGASSGIGALLTRALASDGHRLFICARRLRHLEEVANGLNSVRYTCCDVTDEGDVIKLFAAAAEYLEDIDVLIHCAAISGPVGLITEVDSGAWLDALNTNLFGAFLVIKHAIPLMRPNRRPRVILLGGGGAFDPMPNLSAYGAAKAGIIRLAETLAVELSPRNIAVNVLAPGFVPTEIFDQVFTAGPARGGKLYDIVKDLYKEWKDSDAETPIECARFLISESAAELTGKTISARFDPWTQPEFIKHIGDITKSKLYATQRTNLAHLNKDRFVEELIDAQKRASPPKAE